MFFVSQQEDHLRNHQKTKVLLNINVSNSPLKAFILHLKSAQKFEVRWSLSEKFKSEFLAAIGSKFSLKLNYSEENQLKG